MELANTQVLGQHVRNWIENGQSTALVDYLCTAIYEKRIEKLSRFGNNLKQLGFNLVADGDTDLDESASGYKWVPAAFSRVDGNRAYGGVLLQPKLSSQNSKGFQGFQASAKNAGSSRGGSSKGGSPPSNPNEKSKRDEIMEKYGHGKGWPKTPIRVGDTYIGTPATCKSFKTKC